MDVVEQVLGISINNESDDEGLEVDSSIPQLCLSPEDKWGIRKQWSNALIIKLMGKNIGFNVLIARIRNLWQLHGELKVFELGMNFFVVRFALRSDFDYVLTGGPWIIFDHYLILRKWEPEFRPTCAQLSQITVWIRFPELPIEYFHSSILTKLGNLVGKTVRIDSSTEEVVHAQFARLAVQVDLSKPLIAKVRIGKTIQRVEYEGIHLVCFSCRMYGHKEESCPDLAPKMPEGQVSILPDNTTNSVGSSSNDAPEDLGNQNRVSVSDLIIASTTTEIADQPNECTVDAKTQESESESASESESESGSGSVSAVAKPKADDGDKMLRVVVEQKRKEPEKVDVAALAQPHHADKVLRLVVEPGKVDLAALAQPQCQPQPQPQCQPQPQPQPQCQPQPQPQPQCQPQPQPFVTTITCATNLKKIGSYTSTQTILLVGEGDFSFSASLAVAFGSASNIIATSLNDPEFLKANYANFSTNNNKLVSRGATVLHGIDATEMATLPQLLNSKFDRIVFNFPHSGFRPEESPQTEMGKHIRLVSRFLRNAKKMIKEDGQIHITHKCNAYFLKWNIPNLASDQGLNLIEEEDFNRTMYPGYHTKYGFGGDQDFDCEPSKTYKFGLHS